MLIFRELKKQPRFIDVYKRFL